MSYLKGWDPSLNAKLISVSYTPYPHSLKVIIHGIIKIVLCRKQSFIGWNFLLVASCWWSNSFGFWSIRILDFWISMKHDGVCQIKSICKGSREKLITDCGIKRKLLQSERSGANVCPPFRGKWWQVARKAQNTGARLRGLSLSWVGFFLRLVSVCLCVCFLASCSPTLPPLG